MILCTCKQCMYLLSTALQMTNLKNKHIPAWSAGRYIKRGVPLIAISQQKKIGVNSQMTFQDLGVT